MFKPLTKENVRNIIELLIKDLNKRLEDRQISVELTDVAKTLVIDAAYDPIYGARPLKRYVQKNIETLSAKLILSDQVGATDTIVIDVDERGLTARVKEVIQTQE